ncbi:hypothetical protein, partial [Thiobacillus sp.]
SSPYRPAEDQVWRVDQRQRCLSPAHKKQIQNNQAGRVLCRPPDALDLREFGDVGVAFFWLLFLARQEK